MSASMEVAVGDRTSLHNLSCNNFDATGKASDCLILKQFEECLSICHTGISDMKQSHDLAHSHRAAETIETLCLLAIQAYAELDRWREALPFMLQVYGSIELCPVKLVQLCILLHAHVQDFSTCSGIIAVCLRTCQEEDQGDYLRLVEIYVYHVLLPQKRFSDVKAFLDSCRLDDHSKKEILESCQRLQFEKSDPLSHQVLTDDEREIEAVLNVGTEPVDSNNLTKPTLSPVFLRKLSRTVPLILVTSFCTLMMVYILKRKGYNISSLVSPWSRITSTILYLTNQLS